MAKDAPPFEALSKFIQGVRKARGPATIGGPDRHDMMEASVGTNEYNVQLMVVATVDAEGSPCLEAACFSGTLGEVNDQRAEWLRVHRPR